MKMTKGEHLFKLMTMRLAGELSPGEAEALDRLIAGDPAVNARWEELCATFNPEDIGNHFERLDKAWPTPAPRRTSRLRRFAMPAAAAALVAGLAWWVLMPFHHNEGTARKMESPPAGSVVLQTASGQTVNLSHDSGNIAGWQATANGQSLSITAADDAAGWNRLSVPTGLTYRVVLSDGSRIWLNSTSSLQFPGTFAGNQRRVRLSGEAWMEISPDPANAFVVETNGMEVTVLGTAFNLKAYAPGTVQLSLASGAVRAAASGKTVLVKPGQQVTLSNETLHTTHFDGDDISAWRHGKYFFQQTPLAEIAAILHRAYGLETVFDDPGAAGQTFTGLLNQHKPVTTFLENLQSTTAVRYYFDNAGKLHVY